MHPSLYPSLSLSLSLYLSLTLSISLYISLYMSLSILYLSLYLSLSHRKLIPLSKSMILQSQLNHKQTTIDNTCHADAMLNQTRICTNSVGRVGGEVKT
jgi:hypothetical protein